MNDSFHLSRLQKIDTRLDQITSRLAEINQHLSGDTAIQAAQAVYDLAASELEHASQQLKKLEDITAAQQMKIELSESALYGGKVKNPKELQDLQNEIASLKRHLTVVEDQQLDAMGVYEQAGQQCIDAEKLLVQARADFAARSAVLMGEKTSLEREKEKYYAERSPIIAQVAVPIIEIYERLRKQKRGLAVAAVQEDTCTGCGSTLTPAEWQAARSPNKIVYCTSCGRIVYAG